jgi:hypothetical protein
MGILTKQSKIPALISRLRDFEAECLRLGNSDLPIDHQPIRKLYEDRLNRLDNSHSHSWFGDHSDTYFNDFLPVPAGQSFDVEWGFIPGFHGSRNRAWRIYSRDEIRAFLFQDIGDEIFHEVNSFADQLLHRIFIGHGRSEQWRVLKEFLHERLLLQYEEFNRVSAAGINTQERLSEMLNQCGFAFLVLASEDLHGDGSLHARENVIHESGLFQGRLGWRRAIILLEEGCEEFSNITGLGQIRFSKGNIGSCFEEVRRVLERENVVAK